MHDPMTLVCSVKVPFTEIQLFDIWHVDPETDGSDDSCGWSRPRITDEQRHKLDKAINDDLHYIEFERDSLTDINVIVSAWNCAALALFNQRYWHTKKPEEVYNILMLSNNLGDGFVGIAARMKGGELRDMVSSYRSAVYSCARTCLELRRKWWQHPKYHVHHYKINIIPLRKLRRFIFDRCKNCGKGFKWGEAPCTDSWDSRKFKWWKSDPDVYHSNCSIHLRIPPQSERFHK